MNIKSIIKGAGLLVVVVLLVSGINSMIRPPSRTEIPLAQQYTNLIKEFPQKGSENIVLISQALLKVEREIKQPQPDLFSVVTNLNEIKEFASSSTVKNESFISPRYGKMNVEQFMNLLDGFIDPIVKKLQGSPEQFGQPRPNIPVPPKPGALSTQKPAGLANVGNSCFMNAAIQSLVSLERLNEVLLKPATINLYTINSISAQYINLIKTITASPSATIDPLPFCLSGWLLMQAKPLTQQDAAEFAQLLVQRLISQDVNRAKIPTGINQEIAALFMLTIASGERNLIINEPSTRNIEANETSVRLTIKQADKTLLQCLQNNFKKDELPDYGLIKVNALLGARYYFLSILARTEFVEQKLVKNEQPISFALTNFDISSLSLGKRNFAPYQLKACIIHNGVPGGGHYTAYVRREQNWFFCNDSVITTVPPQEMQAIAHRGYGNTVKDTPVMFFYEQ